MSHNSNLAYEPLVGSNKTSSLSHHRTFSPQQTSRRHENIGDSMSTNLKSSPPPPPPPQHYRSMGERMKKAGCGCGCVFRWMAKFLNPLVFLLMLALLIVAVVELRNISNTLLLGGAAYSNAMGQLLAAKDPTDFGAFDTDPGNSNYANRAQMLSAFDVAVYGDANVDHPTALEAKRTAASTWAFSDTTKLALTLIAERVDNMQRTVANMHAVGKTAVEISSRLPVVELDKISGIILHIASIMEHAHMETPKITEAVDDILAQIPQLTERVPEALAMVDRVAAMAAEAQAIMDGFDSGEKELKIRLKK